MDEKIKLVANSFGLDKVKFNEKLIYHTALKIGGETKLFAVAVSEKEIVELVESCVTLKVPFFIFGTGSKIIFSDVPFDGVVIKNRTHNVRITSIKGKVGKGRLGVESVILEVDSGLEMRKFVEFLKKQGLEYEEFEGVLGSIGGNLFINRSLQSKCESIKVLNLDAIIEIITPRELNLREHVVLSVVLKIKAKTL